MADIGHMLGKTPELLLNATQITHPRRPEIYEFVLDEHLKVTDCVKVESVSRAVLRPIFKPTEVLADMLFELNHVRVNPHIDNSQLIQKILTAFFAIGVHINQPPQANSMAICFRPLGEIRDNIRFYLTQEAELVFLCTRMRPRVIYSRPPSS